MLDFFSSSVMPDQFLVYAGLTALLKYAVYYKFSKVPITDNNATEPKEKILVGKVEEIHFFPLKSARPFNVESAMVGMMGLQIGNLIDRGMAVVHPNGRMVSNLRESRITCIRTNHHDNIVEFEAPGEETLKINLNEVEENGSVRSARVFNLAAEGYDCGDEAAAWISTFLDKRGYRLVYAAPNLKKRNSIEAYTTYKKMMYDVEVSAEELALIPQSDVAFNWVSPMSLVSKESLDDVDEHLQRPVGDSRFRTNLVISGVEKAYDEDTYDDVFIGDVHLKFFRQCVRCPVVNVDPEVGTMERGECTTLNNLKDFRKTMKTRNNTIAFMCINLTVLKPGYIKVGDPVYITRRDPTLTGPGQKLDKDGNFVKK